MENENQNVDLEQYADNGQADNDTNSTNEVDEAEVEEEDTTESETDEEVDNNSEEEKPSNNKEEVSEKERARRAHYAEEKRKRKAEKKTENEAKINEEIKNGKNPFTNLPIEDDADKKEMQEMLDANSKGYDPTSATDMAKYRKAMRKQNESNERIKTLEKELSDMKMQNFIKEDKKKFTDAYPDVDLKELIKNEEFGKFAEGKVGNKPLVDIYNDYKAMVDKHKAELEDEKNKTLARVQSSPGNIAGNDSTPVVKKFDRKEWQEKLRRAKENR